MLFIRKDPNQIKTRKGIGDGYAQSNQRRKYLNLALLKILEDSSKEYTDVNETTSSNWV